MKKFPDIFRMDILKMTRIEAANVPLIARNDLTLEETLAAANRLNDVIQSNFPETGSHDRVNIARDLAQQLGDPNPYLVAGVMRSFYARGSRPNSKPPGGGGGIERGPSRSRIYSAQER